MDLEWLIETATLVAHAETYLLVARTTDWDNDTYRDWLATTWHRLAASAERRTDVHAPAVSPG